MWATLLSGYLRTRAETTAPEAGRMSAKEYAVSSESSDCDNTASTRLIGAPRMLSQKQLLARPEIVEKQHQYDFDGIGQFQSTSD
jgi:hypothetical protein